ncbi:hypothetical protein PHLGIDRAFT_41149, partial [Phlebiopsis gigantea 11061_1 CR5-6]
VVLLAPEQLGGRKFRTFIKQPEIRSHLALLCIDEVHLVDEWGKEFRAAYRSIRNVRPLLPDWTTLLGLTATL